MRSFTLVETLVVIFVFSILTIASFRAIAFLYQTRTFAWQQVLAVAHARNGIEKMTKELREAKMGEDGSFPLLFAGDKEIIFFADIDNDGRTERVRYFLGEISRSNLSQKCVTFSPGGNCQVSFSNFLKGKLQSAILKVGVEGDLGSQNEYVEIYANGNLLGRVCQNSCSDCAGTWQGITLFDVTSFAQTGNLNLLAQASSKVNCGPGEPKCNWEEPNHTMKAYFELQLEQEIQGTSLKKGVIKPKGTPPTYDPKDETVKVISNYIRNAPPIFEYFDEEGNKIEDYPARLTKTKLIKLFLVVNVDPNKPPTEYQLEVFVQPRNLKAP
ncbi:hypothetical protein H5T58_00165 [Candidatus Parcubacteria bacterium]|nr:hypothetical protein [Candidatus Parcubacteria bacterium]